MTPLRFGSKLDLIRRGKGLTIGEFAAKCGVPERTMERICLGANAPSARHLFCILTQGKVSTDAFGSDDFGEDGIPS